MYKVGDKIKCIDNDGIVIFDKYDTIDLYSIYTVVDIDKYGLKLKEMSGGWFSKHRFVNITREMKLKKILCQ